MTSDSKLVCATIKGSDQPAHTRSPIRAFATRLNILMNFITSGPGLGLHCLLKHIYPNVLGQYKTFLEYSMYHADVKIPTIVGILTFMSMKCSVENEINFITLRLSLGLHCLLKPIYLNVNYVLSMVLGC